MRALTLLLLLVGCGVDVERGACDGKDCDDGPPAGSSLAPAPETRMSGCDDNDCDDCDGEVNARCSSSSTEQIPRHLLGTAVGLEVWRSEMTVREVLDVAPDAPVKGLDDAPAEVYLQTARAVLNAMSDRDGLTRCYEPDNWEWLVPALVCDGWRLPTDTEFRALVADHDVPILGGAEDGAQCYGPLRDLGVCYACTCPNGPRPAPASAANALGLHDVLGNVREWVEVAGLSYRHGDGARMGGDWSTNLPRMLNWTNQMGETGGDLAALGGLRPVRDLR